MAAKKKVVVKKTIKPMGKGKMKMTKKVGVKKSY